MMTLNNFETFCPPEILERGMKYYSEGLIYSFEAIDPLHFSAIVVGTDPYAVTVKLDDFRRIQALHCTCPLDLGAVCKHKVAVLQKVREMKRGMAVQSDDRLGSLREKLLHMNKAALAEFVVAAASRNLEARREIFAMAELPDVWDPERFWIGEI